MKKNSIELTLQLPEYLVKTIKTYDRSGDIDANKFVADSIVNHREDVTYDSSLDDVDCKYSENTLPLVIQFPKTQAFELGMEYSIRQHISLSDLVNKVLPHSLANLIAEVQAQEDYMVEVALAKANGQNEQKGGDDMDSSNKAKTWLESWVKAESKNKAEAWIENWVEEESKKV
ncbi:hypothetical protein J6G99_03440 [bacterium]|nr:hypothetical protein [bacterium]